MKQLWIFALAALAGCNHTGGEQVVVAAPPQIERTYLRDIIPSNMLKCKDNPKKTGVEAQRGAAKYIVNLENAGDDCRQKLSGVAHIIATEQ